MFRRIWDNITSHCANVIYLSWTVILEYCDIVWDSCGVCNSTCLEKLQRLQSCAARITMNISDSDEAIDKLKWPTPQNRWENHVFVQKCIKGHCPLFFKNYFTFDNEVHDRTTRQSNMLHLPKVRTETTKSSFYYNGCKIFNRLNSSDQKCITF